MQMLSGLKLVATVTASATLLGGIGNSTPTQEDNLDFTTEQLLDGIIFSSGPVAETLGTEQVLPNSLSSEQLEILDETTDALKINILENTSDDALAQAGDLVTSGDIYSVEEGLRQYSSFYLEALENEYPEVSFEDSTTSASSGVEPNCVVGPAVAVAAVGVIFVGTYNVAGMQNAVLYQTGVAFENHAYSGQSNDGPGLLLPDPNKQEDSGEDLSESISLAQAESVKLVTDKLSSSNQ